MVYGCGCWWVSAVGSGLHVKGFAGLYIQQASDLLAAVALGRAKGRHKCFLWEWQVEVVRCWWVCGG